MTPTTPPALRDYRESHVISPVKDYDDDLRHHTMRCAQDGIRIYPRRGGWRHDLSEVKALAALERGEKIKWAL